MALKTICVMMVPISYLHFQPWTVDCLLDIFIWVSLISVSNSASLDLPRSKYRDGIRGVIPLTGKNACEKKWGVVTGGEWETQRSLEELPDCDAGLTQVGLEGRKKGWVGSHTLWYNSKKISARLLCKVGIRGVLRLLWRGMTVSLTVISWE